jgi:hypothetical protein
MPVSPSLYDPLIPQATDQLSVSQGELLNNFGAIASLVDVNHGDFAAATAGKHLMVEFPPTAFGSLPTTPLPGEMTLYANTSPATGNTEIFLARGNGVSILPNNYAITAYGSGSGSGQTYAWTRLSSGMVLLWGSVGTGGVANFTVTFPTIAGTIPFSTSIFSAQVTQLGNSVVNNSAIYLTSSTTSSLTVFCCTRQFPNGVTPTVAFNYFVVGI